MSSNPYIHYYVNQAGSGIGGFQGARFQKGQGWFGNVFKSAILPLLKYLGKQSLSTGVEVAQDALDGENLLESVKTRGKMAARNIAKDALTRAKRFSQTGTGRRRRRQTKQVFKKKSRKPRKTKSKKTRRVRRRKVALPSIFT